MIFLRELLDTATAPLGAVEQRRAFGSVGYYVDGRMFALAYGRGERIGVKLPEAAAFAEAMALPDAEPWAPHGAPMTGWVLLPADLHDDSRALAAWVGRAHTLVQAAPDEVLAPSRGARASSAGKAAPASRPKRSRPSAQGKSSAKATKR
jgi:TfoX/Sxy family transcriptional regulator of competence genes